MSDPYEAIQLAIDQLHFLAIQIRHSRTTSTVTACAIHKIHATLRKALTCPPTRPAPSEAHEPHKK